MKATDYYVYVYIDPRDFKPFYYGKGKGSRKEAHLFGSDKSNKSQRIDDIRKEGLDPLIRVLARGLTEEQALLIEATLIWEFKDTILNKSGGHFSKSFRRHKTLHKEIVGFDYNHQLWYFNVGDGEHRRWEDNITYSYVGAGQKRIFRDFIDGLAPGDVIAAYLSGKGYVGIGKISGQAKPAKEFRLSDGSLLIDKPGLAPNIKDNLNDLDNCEWMSPVKWVKTVGRKEAHFQKNVGLFTPGSPSVTCRTTGDGSVPPREVRNTRPLRADGRKLQHHINRSGDVSCSLNSNTGQRAGLRSSSRRKTKEATTYFVRRYPVATQSETAEEGILNIREAIQLYVDT